MSDAPHPFYQRSNEFIGLANKFNKNPEVKTGEVSASFMYSVARYNAWFASTGFENAEQMTAKKAEIMEYYIKEYREMLEANMDDYIQSFAHYRETQK